MTENKIEGVRAFYQMQQHLLERACEDFLTILVRDGLVDNPNLFTTLVDAAMEHGYIFRGTGIAYFEKEDAIASRVTVAQPQLGDD